MSDFSRNDGWRPTFHIAPPKGWLNDPNGLCQINGVYHAFFQYSPEEVNGGQKYWGHLSGTDLMHWEFQGIAISPDSAVDRNGAYSGSCLVENGVMNFYYTGNVKEPGSHDFITSGRQANTVLVSSTDGVHFSEKKLLMTNKDYPSDLTCHVRDPKVWKQDGKYYMVQGARTREDTGEILVFESEDKEHWKCINRITSEKKFGYMWECPDLFELDGSCVLGVSPQGVKADGLKYQNVYQTGSYFLEGDFRGACRLSEFTEMDRGFDFYAPQTFEDEMGRRILIGWMGVPDSDPFYNNEPTVKNGWQHTLTIPRELAVVNKKLIQRPVRELQSIWNCEEKHTGNFEAKLPDVCEIDISCADADLCVTLAEGLQLKYCQKTGIFEMVFVNSIGCGRTSRGVKIDSLQDLQIIADVSCLEVFVNSGEEVFSTRFYPETRTLTWRAEGKNLSAVLKYQ